ncbi:hypothetical protein HYW55_00465 [Candidatus Gottesmanbacteria bacterium]|nr:hypothetical protein [Candidatus Gottesmanbacteria bacterium]
MKTLRFAMFVLFVSIALALLLVGSTPASAAPDGSIAFEIPPKVIFGWVPFSAGAMVRNETNKPMHFELQVVVGGRATNKQEPGVLVSGNSTVSSLGCAKRCRYLWTGDILPGDYTTLLFTLKSGRRLGTFKLLDVKGEINGQTKHRTRSIKIVQGTEPPSAEMWFNPPAYQGLTASFGIVAKSPAELTDIGLLLPSGQLTNIRHLVNFERPAGNSFESSCGLKLINHWGGGIRITYTEFHLEFQVPDDFSGPCRLEGYVAFWHYTQPNYLQFVKVVSDFEVLPTQ